MYCPECKYELGYTVADDREDHDYKHIFEICAHCGFIKAYVEYEDKDTGPINYSGIEH
jgi:RNase P subunit RPR2